MAIQNSFVKIKGSIGGLTFYESDGKSLIRTEGGVDKNRIMNDPNYRRTRENMQEFGAAAAMGKSFRIGFAGIGREVTGKGLAGRVTGIMKRLNRAGEGIRGERSFTVLPNKQMLEGFQFQPDLPFRSVLYAPLEAPEIDANRSVVTWTVPDFNTENYIQVPNGATHARLVLHVAVLSDYVFDEDLQSYRFVNPEENERQAAAYGAEFALKGMVGGDTVLTADLGLGAELPETSGVLIGTGILFYQRINGLYYALTNNSTFQIAKVG